MVIDATSYFRGNTVAGIYKYKCVNEYFTKMKPEFVIHCHSIDNVKIKKSFLLSVFR